MAWARFHPDGYEVSSAGDRRFSALYATLKDGRTIEEAYQLDIKGYRCQGDDWRLGKGKPGLSPEIDLWQEYLELWRQWARENPALIAQLRLAAGDRARSSIRFASGPISQARALDTILHEC